MNRFFNMDSPVFQFLSRLADLMILNILFILTCIPIVTIGAAWTSLYYVTLKMVRNEESYIVRSYFKSFKQNFRQSTVMWLIIAVFTVVMVLDFSIIGSMTDPMKSFMLIALTVISLIILMILMYAFPVMAKFYNTVKNTFLHAFLMSIRHLPQTLIMLAITAGAVILTFWNSTTFTWGLLVWLMAGFSLIAFANSWFLVKIFDKYIPQEPKSVTEETLSDEPFADP